MCYLSSRTDKKRAGYSWRFWAAPILLGMPVAIAIGVYISLPTILQHGYFHFHLFRTGLILLGQEIDRWAPGIVGFLLLLQWAFLVGNRMAGRAGKALCVALPLAVTVATAVFCVFRFPEVRLPLQNFARDLPPLAAGVFAHPVTLGLLFAALLAILVRIRHRGSALPVSPHQRHRAFRRVLAGVLTAGACLCIIAYLGIHLAVPVLNIREGRAAAGRPNVIFIMADTLRADHVGCYGYDLPTTPNIDRFARESTRFEHAVAQSSWTVWSVGSLMASRYPESLFPRWIDRSQTLPFAGYFPQLFYPVLAEVLRDKGYATHAVISNPYLKGHPTNTQGYDGYDDSPLAIPLSSPSSPAVTEAALKRLQAIEERKFFLYLLYMDPHSPYLQHPEFSFGGSAQDAARDALAAVKDPAQRQSRRDMLRAYDSDIALTDHYIGQFLDTLKQQGLYDDALIVFFSDHGEEFLEHGRFGHLETVYEEVIQVPLIIKFPQQRQGRVVRGTFALIDLYPSVLKYLHIDASALALQGQAFDLPTLLRCPERPLYAATVEGVQGVRDGARKYIRTLDAAQLEKQMRAGVAADLPIRRLETYDLTADPLEQTNLLPEFPALAAPLAALLQGHDDDVHFSETNALARGWPFRQASTDRQVDADLIKQLRSLGYLNPGAPTAVEKTPPPLLPGGRDAIIGERKR